MERRQAQDGGVAERATITIDARRADVGDDELVQQLDRARAEVLELRRELRLKDEYVATANHELATPLTAIKAYVEALVEHHKDPTFTQTEQFLLILKRETARLIRTVQRTLQLSKLASGTQVIAFENVVLQDIVGEVEETLVSLVKERGVELVRELPAAPLVIHGDRDLLKQVLINLLQNAIKFSPRGSQVLLRLRSTAEHAHVEVRDQGYGIAREEIEMVFEPFFRSADRRVTAERGTGLGLTVVRSIIQHHGGQVRVESELDNGTAFCFSIPRAQG